MKFLVIILVVACLLITTDAGRFKLSRSACFNETSGPGNGGGVRGQYCGDYPAQGDFPKCPRCCICHETIYPYPGYCKRICE